MRQQEKSGHHLEPRDVSHMISPSALPTAPDVTASPSGAIIGNHNGKRYHRPDCPRYVRIAPPNRMPFTSEAEAQAAGYQLAGNCP
jgi:deoxyribonuclease-1